MTSSAAAPSSRASPTRATPSSPPSESRSARRRWPRRPRRSASRSPRRWPRPKRSRRWLRPPRASATSRATSRSARASIGQGQVLATPVQMASVAQTIANDGVRAARPRSSRRTSSRPDAEPVEVTSPETADKVEDLMLEVVRSGTGRRRPGPGIQVAGKTGTAETGPTELEPGQTLAPGRGPAAERERLVRVLRAGRQARAGDRGDAHRRHGRRRHGRGADRAADLLVGAGLGLC